MEQTEYLLEMKNISKFFPGVKALDQVGFTLKRGEVHVLLGENGAGKSTLMKVLAGAYVPDAGEVLVEGKKVERFSPRRAQSLGVGIIYQEFNLVPYINVAQNIFIDEFPKKWFNMRIDHKKMHVDADSLLASLSMNVDTHAIAQELPVAQQQMVEVAKALTHDLKILVMDEPTSALSDREIEKLFDMIRALTAKGIGIIFISHRLQEIPLIGDRITILRDGKYIGTREVRETTSDQMVSMMVGRDLGSLFHRDFQKSGEQVLKISNLSSKKTGLKHINLELNRGEIVGIAGLVGSGRSELARAAFQADKYEEGEVFFFGEKIKHGNPRKAIQRGMSLIPEDRKRQGLSLILTVAENIVLSSLSKLYPTGFISFKKEDEIVKKYIKDLRIATPHSRQIVQNLSGGNQQKVVLAKCLCTEAEIYIFDEPTRGIDVGAKGEIYSFMNELAKMGKAVLMISSELPEIIGMCDRIYVMREGNIVADYNKENATQEKIIAHAMGAKKEECTI